ncbi:hypothetical protein NBRC116583_25140 [Arenicella sp. 4NH20-0111]|uniref:sulfotransferase domain-containing protein n=1 Tax=Arenicella sp. 4NH20-0111 TaxID=3127648 RepID=UPI0031092E46
MTTTTEIKPNFIIVGAAKSGTTSLYSYLKANPDIFLPDFKEPHYFAKNHAFNFDVLSDRDAYYRLFEGQQEPALGEASTAYLYFPDIPDNIHAELPNCKIIALVRNPTERALSLWGHQIREGLEEDSLEQAIKQELAGTTRSVSGVEYGFNYCRQGLIADNIDSYISSFGKNNVYIADYQQLRTDPQELINQICDFLDVPPHRISEKNNRLNASGNPKFGWFHKMLNSKHPVRQALVLPLKLFMPAQLRHKLWSKLRNWNILQGRRHQIDLSTKNLLDQYFASDVERVATRIQECRQRSL